MSRMANKQSRISDVKDAFRRIGVPLVESRVQLYMCTDDFHNRDADKCMIFSEEMLAQPQPENNGSRPGSASTREFFCSGVQDLQGSVNESSLPSGERLAAEPEQIGSIILRAVFQDFELRVIETGYTVEGREVQGEGCMVIAPDLFEMEIFFSKNTSDALKFLVECTMDKEHHYSRHLLINNPTTGLYGATLRIPERFDDLEGMGKRLSTLIDSVSARDDLVKAAEAGPAIGELRAAAEKLSPERRLTADIREQILKAVEGFEGMVRDALDSIANNEAKDSALGVIKDRQGTG